MEFWNDFITNLDSASVFFGVLLAYFMDVMFSISTYFLEKAHYYRISSKDKSIKLYFGIPRSGALKRKD